MSIVSNLSGDSMGLREAVGSTAPSRERIRESAQEFEALLMAQLLRQVREAAEEHSGETMATVMEMAEQRLAEVMAAQGGLGLAGLVLRQLERQ